MIRITLFALLFFLCASCGEQVSLPSQGNYKIANLDSGEKLVLKYEQSGHISKKGKFIFTKSSVEIPRGNKLDLLPNESAILDKYFLSIENDDGKGRCSVATNFNLKVIRNGKGVREKTLNDTYCRDDSKNITLSALALYFDEKHDEPFWRSGKDVSLVE